MKYCIECNHCDFDCEILDCALDFWDSRDAYDMAELLTLLTKAENCESFNNV